MKVKPREPHSSDNKHCCMNFLQHLSVCIYIVNIPRAPVVAWSQVGIERMTAYSYLPLWLHDFGRHISKTRIVRDGDLGVKRPQCL